MPTVPTIEQLLSRYEPRLASAFREAIREISDSVIVSQVRDALEQGDLTAAVEALYIDQSAFSRFETVIDQGFSEGGTTTIQSLGPLRDQEGSRFVFRFNRRSLEAEAWLREYSSGLITSITDEQRRMSRLALEEAMEAGRNPRDAALDLVGRVNRQTGRREGGFLGLSEAQYRAVANARQDLESGNYSSYLARQRRDRRFDAIVSRAASEGRPLSRAQITRIVGRYNDRLLKLRGETIGRTEMLTSLHVSQHQALMQLVADGRIRADQIRRVWKATRDERTRFSHAVADGQTVGLRERFVMPTGALLMHPGDPSGPAAEVINCRCTLSIRIDYRQGVR